MTTNRYSGVTVFITVGGKLFKAEELDVFEVNITDSDEGDNEVELKCLDNDFKIADSALFRVGSILGIKWGYTATGDFSAERTGYVILKPGTHYSRDGVVSTIKAKTKSATMAARHSQKSYNKTTIKTIVKDIAQRNQLKLELSGGDEVVDGFSQGNWSDRQVLRTLADRYGYQVSYSSETVTFGPRDFGATPKLALIFGMGEDSNVISAQLNVDSHSSAGAGVGVTTFDPKAKESKTDTSMDLPKELAAFSADNGFQWTVPGAGGTSAEQPQEKPGILGKLGGLFGLPQSPTATDQTPSWLKDLVSSPDATPGSGQAHATSLNSRSQKKQAELTVDVDGIPSAHARMIVEVKGLSKRDSGLYYVSKVHHKIKIKSAYECVFDLNRHGVNAGGGAKNKSPKNDQTADNGKPTTKTAVVEVSAHTGGMGVKEK